MHCAAVRGGGVPARLGTTGPGGTAAGQAQIGVHHLGPRLWGPEQPAVPAGLPRSHGRHSAVPFPRPCQVRVRGVSLGFLVHAPPWVSQMQEHKVQQGPLISPCALKGDSCALSRCSVQLGAEPPQHHCNTLARAEAVLERDHPAACCAPAVSWYFSHSPCQSAILQQSKGTPSVCVLQPGRPV